ncbi:MAG: TRAP transporter substrate-binding protein DctP [Bacillota bacterium]
MKKYISLSICLFLLLLIVSGCSGSGNNSQQSEQTEVKDKPITLKLAGQFPLDNPASIAAENVKKYVEEKSQGRLLIETYPANQLGDANLVYEGIMDGSVDMGLLYNSSQYDPMIEINSLPYLSTDIEAVKKVYSPGSNYYSIYSEIFKKMNVKIMGIHVDGLIGVHGKKTPVDYKDFTKNKQAMLRIPAVDVYKLTATDMGYPTVTIPFADLYTSMQTGVCDASIGQTVIGAYTGFRDVDKYFIPYRVFVECLDYMINMDKWNSLPADLQQILQEAVDQEVQKQFDNVVKNEEEYSKKLQAEGIEIMSISDQERNEMAEYIRKTTWPKLYDKFGEDVMKKILEDVE